MKWKQFILFVVFCFTLFGLTKVNAQSISGNTYFYDQQFNVSYGSFPAWSNGFGESGTFPTSTYHTVAKSVSGPYINTVRDVYVSNTNYSFTAGNSYKLTLVFNKGSYLLPQSSALYGLTNNRNLSLCRLYGQSTGNMTCSISWADSDETMVATVYMNTQLSGSGFELQIGNLNAGTNCFVYNSSFDYSQGIKLTSADIIQDNSSSDNIINNQNNNTTNIINNQNQNTQTIINNQNENTDREIESQKVCSNITIDKNSIIQNNYYLNSSGVSVAVPNNETFGVTDYYEVVNGTDIKLLDRESTAGGRRICFYNSNKAFISCNEAISINIGSSVTVPTNASYVRFTINYINNLPQWSFKLCKNGNQALSDDINDLNNTLKDDSLDEFPSGGGGGTYFDDINGSSDTPISDLLLLPLNLYNKIKTNLQTQCTPYTIPFDFTGGNNTLTFPCLNLEQHLGSNLWSIIDGLFCIFMIYNIFNLCISTYDSITNLDDLFPIFHGSSFYSGRHEPGQYAPRHGGD